MLPAAPVVPVVGEGDDLGGLLGLVISTLAYNMSDVARPWAKNVGTARVRWERRDDSAPVTGSRPG